MNTNRVLLIRIPSLASAAIGYPLGLAYLGGSLESNHIPVQIIDGAVQKFTADQLIRQTSRFRPTIIGFGAATHEIPAVTALAKLLRQHFPDCLFIIGGPHVSALPAHTLRRSCFDLAVIGEGESAVTDIVNAYPKTKQLSAIPGIAFKKKNQIILTKPRPPIANLNHLPLPAYHLLPPFRFYRSSPGSHQRFPVAGIITARGCPSSCTFCCHAVFGKHARFRHPASVVSEIEILIKRFGAREIRFWDDTFNLNPDRAIQICRLIRKRRLVFPWTCQCRVNYVNLPLLEEMKKSGCWQISYGIESGSQPILNLARKGITLKMIRRAVTMTKKAGIETKGFFVLGLPGETPATAAKTIDFAKKLDLDLATFAVIIPFPGTQIWTQAIREHRLQAVSFDNYTPEVKDRLAYTPPGLTAKELFALRSKAYRQFYRRPKIIGGELKKIRDWPSLKNRLQGFFMSQV